MKSLMTLMMQKLFLITVHTRMRSVRVMLCSYCISSLNACFTVKFDGSCCGDKDWLSDLDWMLLAYFVKSGLSTRTSCLAASRTSVTRSTASRSATSQPSSLPYHHNLGVRLEDADRSRRGRLQGKSTGLTPALLGRGLRRPTIWTTST